MIVHYMNGIILLGSDVDVMNIAIEPRSTFLIDDDGNVTEVTWDTTNSCWKKKC